MTKHRPEEALQKQVAQFLDIALPPDESFWWHTPNQRGTRKEWENKLLKAFGVKAGVPDCMIIWKGRTIGIELKAPAWYLSTAQKEAHRCLTLAGAVVCVCRSLPEVANFLDVIGIPLKAKVMAWQLQNRPIGTFYRLLVRLQRLAPITSPMLQPINAASSVVTSKRSMQLPSTGLSPVGMK